MIIREKATEMVMIPLKEKDPWTMKFRKMLMAWFTPQIPMYRMAQGNTPAGLPGLILNWNVDRTTILCSKIVLNT